MAIITFAGTLYNQDATGTKAANTLLTITATNSTGNAVKSATLTTSTTGGYSGFTADTTTLQSDGLVTLTFNRQSRPVTAAITLNTMGLTGGTFPVHSTVP